MAHGIVINNHVTSELKSGMAFANNTISGRSDGVDSHTGIICFAKLDAKSGHDTLEVSQPQAHIHGSRRK